MLDRLPTELVAHILSFVDPPSPYRLTKPTSLYACCLVSKRVKEVAQPLLWRTVSADRLGDYEAIKPEATSTGLLRYTRVLEVNRTACDAEKLEELVQSLTGLREIRLRNHHNVTGNAVDTVLPHFTHLRRITLVEVDFLEIRQTLTFPTLFSLSLDGIYTTSAFLDALLVPQNLPQLRILSLWTPGTSTGGDVQPFLPSLDVAFCDQLDVLRLAHEDLYLANMTMMRHGHTLVSASLILLDLPTYPPQLASLPWKNLHIRPFRLDSSLPALAYQRAKLVKLAFSLPHLSLSTLLLPLQLQHPSLRFERDSILAACKKKRIDVLWEDALDEKDAEILIAEKFRDWRLKKEKEEAERAG
ncbi:hypothetical protein JCM6882_004995 [Rhodosporidiobolus microsporus]